jgi:hypothetical protein
MEVSEMTNLHAHSTPLDQTPVADVKVRLAQILKTAGQLYDDAELLALNVDELRADLKEIVRGPGNTALAAALDCAEWIDSAALNVRDELSTLVEHLYDAGEEPIAPHTVAAEPGGGSTAAVEAARAKALPGR